MGSEKKPKIPVIEFNNENLSPGTDCRVSTSHLVRDALESYGCFVAVYKRIPMEIHEKIFNVSKELYKLPDEIKEKNVSEIGYGFGYSGKYQTLPLLEYFGITNAATVEGTQDFTNLMWPAGNHDFFETALSYSRLLSELNQVVVKMVLESYGIDKYYGTLEESCFYTMRFLKYRTPKVNEINVGLGPHVDKTFLGVIATNHVKGLEIENKNGDWISFEPSPFAFLVLSGEVFTAWSNDRVYSPLHRVVMGGEEEKYSVALFCLMRETLRIPNELVDQNNPLKYKPLINNFELLDYSQQKRISGAAIKDLYAI